MRTDRTKSARDLVAVPVWVLVLAMFLAACGSGGQGTQKSGGLTDLGRRLPKEVQDARVLRVGSDIAYAPVEFFKAGTGEVQGLDPDLCAAMVKKFGEGFTCRFENTKFDGIIPALAARRFDVVMSALSDKKERQAKIDFVDYFNAGTSILVRKGNPQRIRTLDDLCGKTVGLQQGTIQEELAQKQKAKCDAAGRNLTLLAFEKDTDALGALKAGRSAADMNDYPVAAYNAKTSGGGQDFEVVGQRSQAGPYGIGVRKEDAQLRDALAQAMQATIDDGTYMKVLERWNVPQGALQRVTINAGSS